MSTLFANTHRSDARHASRGWQDLIVDNFAGGGGASLGIERATGRAVDVSINHDPDAVAMHAVNHPASWHVCESVWRFKPVADLVKRFGRGRFKFDAKGRITDGVGLAWFSPDCRHFSRAKGGKPVSKQVRGLAWVVVKWAALVRPRVIILENVREFEQWGPIVQVKDAAGKPLVDANGQPVLLPCPNGRGKTFRRWTRDLRRLGYQVEHRVLDAADYGAPTHRRRLFLVARRDGRPIVWPERTHGSHRDAKVQAAPAGQRPLSDLRGETRAGGTAQRPEPVLRDAVSPAIRPGRDLGGCCGALSTVGARALGTGAEADGALDGTVRRRGPDQRTHRRLKPYRTAAECIDWSIPCPSIFDRKKPLADKTLRRIAMGLKRYVLDNPNPYIVKVNHGRDAARSQPADQPLTTVASRHGDALVTPTIVRVAHGDGPNGNARWGQSAHSVDEPLGTVLGSKDYCVATATLVGVGGRAGQSPPTDVGAPLSTITAKGDRAVAVAHLTKFRFDSEGADLQQPMPTVTAGGNAGGRPAVAAHAMAVTAATLVQTGYGEAAGEAPRCLDIEEPLGTVVAACLTEVGNTGGNGEYVRPVDEPNATQTSKAKDLLVTAFLAKHCGGPRAVLGQEVDRPIGTVTSVDHHALVAAHVTRMNHGQKQWSAADEPLGTVTSQGLKFGLVYAFLTKYFGTAVGQTVDAPLHTATGKARFSVVTVEIDGTTYAIADIGMRMLSPRELARAQGFPDTYVLTGSKANQVHKIGNSVCPVMAEVMVRANCPELAATGVSS